MEYSPSGKVIPQTLQAAAQIRRIIHDVDEDPDAIRRFKGVYRGKTYRWSNFFFEADHDTRRLAKEISDGNPYTDHPLVVRGRVLFVDKFGKDENGRKLVLASVLDAVWPSTKQQVQVTVRSDDASRLPYRVGDTVIAYGVWKRFSPGGKKDEAQLWVNEPRSVTKD